MNRRGLELRWVDLELLYGFRESWWCGARESHCGVFRLCLGSDITYPSYLEREAVTFSSPECGAWNVLQRATTHILEAEAPGHGSPRALRSRHFVPSRLHLNEMQSNPLEML